MRIEVMARDRDDAVPLNLGFCLHGAENEHTQPATLMVHCVGPGTANVTSLEKSISPHGFEDEVEFVDSEPIKPGQSMFLASSEIRLWAEEPPTVCLLVTFHEFEN